MSTRTPTFVLGGTGYVAGELLRLIAGHPQLALEGLMSDSQPGESVGKAFPHLRSAFPDTTFLSLEDLRGLVSRERECALFSAAPHGVSASLIDRGLHAPP